MENGSHSRNKEDEAYSSSWNCNIDYHEYDECEFEDYDDTEHWRKPCYSRIRDHHRRCSHHRSSYGLTSALKNSSKISKLAILNSPLTDSSSIPGLFQQLRIPLYGEFTSQNAIIAERFIEGGSPCVSKNCT
ncbi:hypothetical protein VNO80_00103 [Phaseolus coccineus]|uniref:Uncharacterized protein n=1 Tax=Phaseolus coccineus TaxID=3886 RepID=A0AAN9RSD5_PHACN